MRLSDLAAKQKRAQYWRDFVESEVYSEALRSKFVQCLNDYNGLLAKCWERGEVADTDLHEILKTERELQELDEQARLTNEAEH